MKYIVLPFIFLFYFSLTTFSQQQGEIGLFGGVGYYHGEINQTKPFYNVQPAYGLIYRYNFNSRIDLRFDGVYSTLKGNDADFISGYQQTRNASFSTNITDFGVEVEFNFLPFDKKSEWDYFSPYIMTGVALSIITPATKPIQVSIPIGFGFKYALSKRFCIGAEWCYRKSMSDEIDQVLSDSPNLNLYYASKQKNNSFNKDWYSFMGIHLTVTMLYNKSKCPAFNTSNK